MIYGDVSISSDNQDFGNQVGQLKAAGCAATFHEKMSAQLGLPPNLSDGASGSAPCGRADAKAKGVKFEREPILTPRQQREARGRLDAGETQNSVARSYNVGAATISRMAA